MKKNAKLSSSSCETTASEASTKQQTTTSIANYLADQSGIKNRQLEIPDVELPHYHCQGDGWQNLLTFASSLSDWIDDEFDLFFDAFGVLNLRSLREYGERVFEFKRGKNALLIKNKMLKAFPVPLSYGDTIRVSNKLRRILGLYYLISPQNSLMQVMF